MKRANLGWHRNQGRALGRKPGTSPRALTSCIYFKAPVPDDMAE